MTHLRRILLAIRAPDWFSSKLPPLLFIGIAAAAMTDPSPRSILKKSIVWMAATFAMAVIGYVANDHFDRDSDAASGKSSVALPPRIVWLVCAGACIVELLVLAIGRPFAFAAAVASNAIGFFYSAPPLRWKERRFAGVLADATAACLMPAAVMIGVAWPELPSVTRPQLLFAAAAMSWALLYGLRGIIVHQLWDERPDARAGLSTYVRAAGADRAWLIASSVVFPLELAALAAMLATGGFTTGPWPLVVMLYIAWDVIRRRVWNVRLDPAPPVRGYVLGAELVELWLPLAQLAMLIRYDERHLLLAVLWLALFHRALLPRVREVGAVIRNAMIAIASVARRPLVRPIAITVVCLVLLEATLQVAALAVSLTNRPQAAPANRGNAVLCIGDSFTYGFGASDRSRSYPAQLQAMFGSRVQVMNRAWPGQNSYEVASRIASELQSTRPRVVYLLVGANDGWSSARRYEGGAVRGGRFETRLRTLRLARLAWAALATDGGEAKAAQAAAHAPARPPASSPAAAPGDPFAGTWYSGEDQVAFTREGTLRYTTGGGNAMIPARYEVRGDRITLFTSSQRHEYSWQRDRDRLILRRDGSPSWVLSRTRDRRPPPPCAEGNVSSLVRAWAALQRNDLDYAEACFRTQLADRVFAPHAHLGLVQLHLRRDMRDRAAAELRNLEAGYARHHDAAWAASLAEGTAAVSMRRGIEVARTMLESYPENAPLWKTLAWNSFVDGDAVTARKAIDNAIRFSASASPEERVYYHFLRSSIVREADPASAVLDLALAYAIKADEPTLRTGLWGGREVFTEAMVESALRSSPLDAAGRERVRAVYRESIAPDTVRLRTILGDNLRAAIRESRRAGAEVVLVSYPFADQHIDDTARSVAAEMNVVWLNLHDEFDRRLRARARAELFVADGHCNDRGYRLMAELIGRDLRRRIERKGASHGS